MLPAQRVLRVAVPATLLIAFGVWVLTAPPSSRDRGSRSRFQRSMLGQVRSFVPVNAETQRALETTVTRQLDAFKKGDYPAALRFAAANFRKSFTPEQFGQRVRQWSPQIAASKKATFGAARRAGESGEMLVTLKGRDGSQKEYVYLFAREGGAWRIRAFFPNRLPTPPAPRKTRLAAQRE